MAAPIGPGAALDAALTALTNTVAANHNATQAQLAALTNTVTANHNAAQAQHAATQGQLAAAVAAMQAQLGAIVNSVLAITSARAENAHLLAGVPYTVVPLPTGAAPQHWPPGLDRQRLRSGLMGPIDALLAEYGLPAGPPAGAAIDRRRSLARMIGTPGI